MKFPLGSRVNSGPRCLSERSLAMTPSSTILSAGSRMSRPYPFLRVWSLYLICHTTCSGCCSNGTSVSREWHVGSRFKTLSRTAPRWATHTSCMKSSRVFLTSGSSRPRPVAAYSRDQGVFCSFVLFDLFEEKPGPKYPASQEALHRSVYSSSKDHKKDSPGFLVPWVASGALKGSMGMPAGSSTNATASALTSTSETTALPNGLNLRNVPYNMMGNLHLDSWKNRLLEALGSFAALVSHEPFPATTA